MIPLLARRLCLLTCLLLFAGPLPARAQKEAKLRLGVFLPTTIVDGQERFQVSEDLAVALEKALGVPVAVRNFGRYEDFAKARSSLDVVVVDAWAAVHLRKIDDALAMGVVAGDTHQRWAIVSTGGAWQNASELAGKRLAVPRGVNSLDPKFVSHVIFGGDLSASHFKLQAVPTGESALRAMDTRNADAALVPALHAPKEARVLYRSARLPGVVVLRFNGDSNALTQAFTSLPAVGPLQKFVPPRTADLAALDDLLIKGPPRRLPVMAESPVLPPSPEALINVREVKLVLPGFLDLVESSRETPDD
jgi:hypothetical protein